MSSQLHVACTRALQLIYTTADQSGVGSHFGLCSALLLCSFFFVCHFYKIKTEEHRNLHNATLLRRFRFYVGENSRTFQDRIVEFKDFSRIFGNPGLFKDNYKIQGLFKTVRTLVIVPLDKASVSCILGCDEGFSGTVGCLENEGRRRIGRNSPGNITITGF